MSLDNETRQAYDTKSFYKEYTDGMTADVIGRGFHEDSTRLKSLYKEAIQSESKDESSEPVPVHERFLRLMGALGKRLSPVRRLVFGVSFVLFFFYLLFGGPVQNLAMSVSFFAMIMLIMLELLEKLDVRREIDLARDIQLSLLPDSKIRMNGIDYVSFANTAQEVGGDYLDIIPTKNGTYVIIADVSGKGLSAALYMVRMQSMVHLLISEGEISPKELLVRLNQNIKSSKRDKTFITACAAYFPNDKEEVTLVRAGHNAPFLFQEAKGSVTELRSTGFALGMTRNSTLEKQLKEITLPFLKSDTLLFYTDGLSEARNSKNEEYGENRLRSLFELYASMPAPSLMIKIQSSLESFIENERLKDDITFTAVQRIG